MSEEGSAIEATADRYGVAGVPGVESLDPGRNLLVTGPAMSGKRRLGLNLLSPAGPSDSAIVVTTDRGSKRFLEGYRERAGPENRLCIVDCSGQPQEVDAYQEWVSSPGDLTGIGIGIVKCTGELEADRPEALRVGTFSLSTILQYAPPKRVFHFVHILTGRFSKAEYLSVWSLDPTTVDEQHVNSLRSLFDGEIQLRESDTGTELRVRGLEDAPSEWVAWR